MYRVSGAMANASSDLDNAEAQRQLNNNNRPIGSGFWETECTSSKLFECSRIKALAGQKNEYAPLYILVYELESLIVSFCRRDIFHEMLIRIDVKNSLKKYFSCIFLDTFSSLWELRILAHFVVVLRWTRCSTEENFHQMG